MLVHDLGSLLVEADGTIQPCSGTRQAALLATLTMNANRRVSMDELIVAAWGYDAQVSTSSVENHIWRLRRMLEPGRGTRAPASRLVSDRGGYRLVARRAEVDSLHFEALADQTRIELDDGHPDKALDLAEQALSKWRGSPYEAVSHAMMTSAVVARLEEIRGQLIERRIEALIGTGQTERAVADLEVLTVELPFREQLWCQRLAALNRLGRIEEALRTYERARTLMRDELGLEPGAALRELHRTILAQEQPTEIRISSSVGGRRPQTLHLPIRATTMIGRAGELRRATDLLTTSSLVTLTGPGGCGKTRLAIEIAQSVSKHFPDGVWFLDLTELSPSGSRGPGSLVDLTVSRLSLAGDGGGALDTLAAYVLDRRMLLVLDNCEHVLDPVADLVEELRGRQNGQAPRWAVLATSREPIAVDIEVVLPLAPLPLNPANTDPAAISEAAALFLARVTGAKSPADDSADLAMVDRICRAVDGLPLAIELAASRTRSFTLAEIAEQVETDPSRLGRITRGPADHRRTLWSAIEWSYDLLKPDEQMMYRRLAVLPGSFTLPVAAAVGGKDISAPEVPDILARLVHRSLLVVVAPSRPGRPTTFYQLETMRAHALQHLRDAGERANTTDRRDRWVRQLLSHRPRLGRPEEAAWYDTVEDVYPVVRASLANFLVEPAATEVLGEGAGLIWYWYYRTKVHEGEAWLRQASQLTGPGLASLPIRTAHAAALFLLAREEEARRVLHPVLADLGGAAKQEQVLPISLARFGEILVGLAGSAWTVNDFSLMREVMSHLVPLARTVQDADLDIVVDAADVASHLDDDDLAPVAQRGREAYERARSLGNLCAIWESCAVMNITALTQHDPVEGLLWTDRLIDAHRQLGSGGGGVYLEALANFLMISGEVERAVELYAAAYTHNRAAGMLWPARQATQQLFDEAILRLPAPAYQRAWDLGASLTLDEVASRRKGS